MQRAVAQRAEATRLLSEVGAFLPALVARLRILGATEIVLFGSMAHGDPTTASDIDVLVRGLDGEGLAQARGRLSADAPAIVDVVRAESAPPSLLAEVRRSGRTLYAA